MIVAGWRAVNRGDLESLRPLFAPRIEWRESADLPDAAVYWTCEGAFRSIENFSAVFGELEWELSDVLDSDDDVLVLAKTTARHDSGSGVPVDIRVAAIWTLRDELIVRVQWYLNWEEAVQAFMARTQTAKATTGPH